jgi:hypothetical protein
VGVVILNLTEKKEGVGSLRDRSGVGRQGNDRGNRISIENRCQLENTRAKLQRMDDLDERRRPEPTDNALLQPLTLRSLKKRIDQFKEEINRFKCRMGSAARDN